MLSGTGYPTGKKPARVRVWVRTCIRMRVWVFYQVELELAGAGMKRHYPTSFHLLPSLGVHPRSSLPVSAKATYVNYIIFFQK
jgi:hypothetical protein